MSNNQHEIARRTSAALAAIKSSLDDGSVSLFISHHLVELDPAYWKLVAGTTRPSVEQVVDLLELRSHWGGGDEEDDDDGIGIFDFTLPGDVTDYVISVRFNDAGEVVSICMES